MNYQGVLQRALTWGQSESLQVSFPAEFQPFIYQSNLLTLRVHETQSILRMLECITQESVRKNMTLGAFPKQHSYCTTPKSHLASHKVGGKRKWKDFPV